MASCILDYQKKETGEGRIVRCHHDSGINKAFSRLRLLRSKVSNHHRLAKQADLQGDTLCHRPVSLQYGVVRLTDFAILQSGLNLSDCGLCKFEPGLNLSDVFVALHRLLSSHAPVFLGWHLNGVCLLYTSDAADE